MRKRIQPLVGTAEACDDFTGVAGELVFDETNKLLRVHDGETQGGLKTVTEDNLNTVLDEKFSEKQTMIAYASISTSGISFGSRLADRPDTRTILFTYETAINVRFTTTSISQSFKYVMLHLVHMGIKQGSRLQCQFESDATLKTAEVVSMDNTLGMTLRFDEEVPTTIYTIIIPATSLSKYYNVLSFTNASNFNSITVRLDPNLKVEQPRCYITESVATSGTTRYNNPLINHDGTITCVNSGTAITTDQNMVFSIFFGVLG